MCGIVGYVGRQEAAPILLDGLERLEYRGYASAGIAVCGLGHCNDEVIGALTEQARKLWHVSTLIYQEPQIQLAKLLVYTAHFAKAFF